MNLKIVLQLKNIGRHWTHPCHRPCFNWQIGDISPATAFTVVLAPNHCVFSGTTASNSLYQSLLPASLWLFIVLTLKRLHHEAVGLLFCPKSPGTDLHQVDPGIPARLFTLRCQLGVLEMLPFVG